MNETHRDLAATDLRTFDRESVATMVRELLPGAVTAQEVWERLSEFKLRAPDGTWWTVGIATEGWYRFQDGRWSPAENPHARVEGPAWLRGLEIQRDPGVVLARDPPPEAPSLPEESEKGVEESIAVLERIVKDTMAEYGAGRLTTEAAGRLIAKYLLVGRDGAVWTLGCRSGTWYCLRDGIWQRVAAPSPDAIADRDALAAMGDRLWQATSVFLLEDVDRLPEPVTEPFTPPEGFPEPPPRPLTNCPGCEAVHFADARFCTQCGGSVSIVTESAPVPSKARFCTSCGRPLDEAAAFCTGCGAKTS